MSRRQRAALEHDTDENLTASFVAGDMDCDGQVTFDDVNLFIEAVSCASDPNYPDCWPYACPIWNADIDADGDVDYDDIDPFIDLVRGTNAAPARTYDWDCENRLMRFGRDSGGDLGAAYVPEYHAARPGAPEMKPGQASPDAVVVRPAVSERSQPSSAAQAPRGGVPA